MRSEQLLRLSERAYRLLERVAAMVLFQTAVRAGLLRRRVVG